MPKASSSSSIPGEAPDVEQHRARRVGDVGRVARPPVSRHSRKLSIVPKAISPARRALAQPRHGVEQPADLRGGEIGVDHQPGALRHGFGQPLGAPALAQLGGAPVLPDDRVVHRPAGRALPQHRRLALVGDADRGDRAARPRRRSPRGRSTRRSARSPPGRARPSPGADRCWRELDLRGVPRLARPRRTGSRGCWSCPGRSREHSSSRPSRSSRRGARLEDDGHTRDCRNPVERPPACFAARI